MVQWFTCDKGLFSVGGEHVEDAQDVYSKILEKEEQVKLYIMMLWADSNNIPYQISSTRRLNLVVDNTTD